jgi:type VI secretion system protein ImpJ
MNTAAISTADRLPDPVRWTEGMLLSPQHLQQNHQYWQAHVRRQLECAAPHSWGVRTLSLDAGSLAGGVVTLTTLECLLDDGTLVQFAGGALSVNVDRQCQQGGPPVRIYLSVPRSAIGLLGRYAEANATLEADHSGEGDPLSVERSRLRVELKAWSVDHGLPADMCLCPLFDVERDANGSMQLGAYYPPMLRLDAGAFQGERGLVALVRGVTDRLWRKIDELASTGDEAPGLDDLLSGAGSAQLRSARALAAGLPLLDLCVNDGLLHPQELYRALAGVVGALATLGGQPLPYKMAPYDHRNCRPQFRAVCDYIGRRLDALHAEYERFRFTPFKEGYSRRLLDDMHDDVVIELKPQPGQTFDNLAQWLMAANIASDDLLPTVQAQRQNGAIAHRLSAAEARALRLPVDAALFRLKNAPILSAGRDAYRAGAPLMIQGGRREHMPAQILLYRRKLQHGVGPAASAPSHGPVDKLNTEASHD